MIKVLFICHGRTIINVVKARKIGLFNILQLSFYLRFTYFGYVSK